MEELSRWIGSIVSYLVFVTVLMGLLPAARYERYLRLFAGCILILLLFQPVTAFLQLEEPLDQLFRSVSFRQEVYELVDQKSKRLEAEREQTLDRLEEKRLETLFSEYERETEERLCLLAEEEGFQVLSAKVQIDRDPESPDFAKLRQISLQVAAENGEADGTDRPEAAVRANETEIVPVVEVGEIEVTSRMGFEGGKQKETKGDGEQTEVGSTSVRAELSERSSGSSRTGEERKQGQAAEQKAERQEKQQRLKRQIAAYYQVEETYVEIRMED